MKTILAIHRTLALTCLVIGAASSAFAQQGFPQGQGNPQGQGYPQQGYPQGQGNPQGQGYPQGGGFPPPQQPGMGSAPGGGGPMSLDQLMQWERRDMGVAPKKDLHTGAMHGPTPNQIPGGQVITTKGLVPLMQGTQGVKAIVLDVLGSNFQLPGAIAAVPASQPGSFNDQVQQQYGQFLQQVTNGNKSIPIVTYCQGPECWMSYNAALRAIQLGYKNVLWYRGGVEAWQRAGLPSGQAGGMPGGPSGGPGGPGGPGGVPMTGGPGGPGGPGPGGPQGPYSGGQPGQYPQQPGGGMPGQPPGGMPGQQPPPGGGFYPGPMQQGR